MEQVEESALRNKMKLSMGLGSLFAVGVLGYTAIAAKDGRMPITDWVDPMLAGVTLLCIISIQVFVLVCWNQLGSTRVRPLIGTGLIVSQWFYIFGEILSNTITIGEPPSDIGSLFEITGGALSFLAVLGFCIVLLRNLEDASNRLLGILSTLLLIGMIWWFTHPIDQSKPGAPSCVEGNPVYNAFHRSCRENQATADPFTR